MRNDTYEGLEDFIDSGQRRLEEAVKMRNHNALEDFKSTLKTEFVNRAVLLLCSNGDENQGQKMENESRVDFDHNAILRARDDML